MALDVLIVDTVFYWSGDGIDTFFGFKDEHEELLRFAEAHLGSSSQIARMKDYWSNTIYTDDNLTQLVAELDQLIAAHQELGGLRAVMETYRKICRKALQENKAILLLAD